MTHSSHSIYSDIPDVILDFCTRTIVRRLIRLMRNFKISDTESTLEISSEGASDKAPYGDWKYIVELRGPTINARVEVFDHLPQEFSRFFLEIANSWKGWKDDRIYQSLEVSLRIVAIHDKNSYVAFRVELRDNGDVVWKAIQEIRVELGQLSALAEDAVLFTK